MEANNLFVGAGREVITPTIGTLLFGYRPDIVSESVNDDLTATAVAFEYKNTKAVMVSIAICEIANEVSDKLRLEISKATNIPVEGVILSATHTHSGPITVGIEGWGDINHEYCNTILIPQAVKASVTAYNSRKASKLGVGTTDSDIGINRRQLNRDGSISLGQNPWGAYDPIMTVLNFRGLDDSPIVNIIHYCCHGTASGCNHEITRDWSGPMIDRLEEQSGCLTVFFNGAEGDVGPRLSNGLTVGNIGFAMELGAKAANDAVKAYRTIKEYRTDLPMKVITGDIKLPYKQLPPLDEVNKELNNYNGTQPENLVNIDRLEFIRLNKIKDVYVNNEPRKENFTFKQTLLTFGPVAIIPFPFEIFVEVTLRLRAYSNYAYTLCLSNTNGANSYFPSQDQICRGGYEIRTFTAGGTYCLTDDADNKIINANLKLLEE